MGCLLVALGMFFPRVAIVFLVVFSDYIQRAMATTSHPMLLGILGFVFMPYTLLAYTYAMISHGSIDGQYQVLLIIAVLVDVGLIGGGAGRGGGSREKPGRNAAAKAGTQGAQRE